VTHLIPHVWVQDTGIGPKLYAGQIMTSDGRQAGALSAVGHQPVHVPVRFAPLTPAGFDQLATQLADDIKAAAA
jgi:hypothetical protein